MPYDCILLDLSLPAAQGESLIREVLELSSPVPVVLLTGYADTAFALKSLALGAEDYLVKDDLTALSLHKSILYAQERNLHRARVEASELQYRNLFMHSPVPMWVYNDSNLAYTDVNQAAVKHYGYTREEFLGMTLADIRPEYAQAALNDAIATRDGDSGLYNAGIFKHRKKDGTIIDVHIYSSGIERHGKQYRLVLALDVTEKQQYRGAIEAQNKTLRDIAWIQSHLYRAPLARIMSLIDVVKEDKFNADFAREKALRYLTESAEELDTLIREITEKTAGANLP